MKKILIVGAIASVFAASVSTTLAETPQEETQRCQKQCLKVVTSTPPSKEDRRVYHNCFAGCKTWTKDSFIICPDGIGYHNPADCAQKK